MQPIPLGSAANLLASYDGSAQQAADTRVDAVQCSGAHEPQQEVERVRDHEHLRRTSEQQAVRLNKNEVRLCVGSKPA